MSLGDLARGLAIWPWEIEQAAELGWLRIVVRSRSSRGCSVRQSCAMRRMLDCRGQEGRSSLKSARGTGSLPCVLSMNAAPEAAGFPGQREPPAATRLPFPSILRTHQITLDDSRYSQL
jgi:hypothetical protein